MTKEKVKLHTIRTIVESDRGRRNSDCFSLDFPKHIGIKVTNKCNLRCKHCYQWNSNGQHQAFSKHEKEEEISLEVYKKIIDESNYHDSRIYLWGGEPFAHSKISDMFKYLEDGERLVTICTNGTLIDEHIETITQISKTNHLEFLLPLEGFKHEHDFFRGKNNYDKVLKTVSTLNLLKNCFGCKISISIHTVINEQNLSNLYDFSKMLEKLNIELWVLCFPWYISSNTSKDMDLYYEDNFCWLSNPKEKSYSWHAFKYQVSASFSEIIGCEIDKIKNSKQNYVFRLQPDLNKDDIPVFLKDEYSSLFQNSSCLGLSNRIDILPNNKISACKQFNEFFVGDVSEKTISEVWKSNKYNMIRGIIDKKIMPVCSKCNVLYLHSNI